MPDPLASWSDVETVLLRPLTTNESAYIDDLIGQASALLRTAVPSVDQRIANNNADPTDLTSVSAETVAAVVAGAVKRYMVNPTGIASNTQTVGPFSESTSYALRSEKEARGVLQFTSEDIAVLFPDRKRLRVGSIRLKAGMAPRPVGNYGPIPGPDQIFTAIVDFGKLNPVIESQLELDAGLVPAGISVPDGQGIIL